MWRTRLFKPTASDISQASSTGTRVRRISFEPINAHRPLLVKNIFQKVVSVWELPDGLVSRALQSRRTGRCVKLLEELAEVSVGMQQSRLHSVSNVSLAHRAILKSIRRPQVQFGVLIKAESSENNIYNNLAAE